MQLSKQEFTEYKTKGIEKFSYGLSNFGGNLVYATISSFATAFYTDSVGIAAATVGTMMLVARIFDAVSDVAMGNIIDKTHRKNGQAKPWYIWSIIPLIVSLILIFAIQPTWGNTAKIVYMYVTYIWSAVFCYTANSLAVVSMQALMTGSGKERMKLNAIYQIFGFICIILVNMLTSNLAANIGWLKLSIIYAVIAAAMLFFAVVFCHERKHLVETANTSTEQPHTKLSLKESFSILLKNKYAMIILALSIFNYITIGTFNAGGVFYATYIYGQPGLF